MTSLTICCTRAMSTTSSISNHCRQRSKSKDDEKSTQCDNISLYFLLVVCSLLTLPFCVVFTVLVTFGVTAMLYTQILPSYVEIIPKMCFKESALTKYLMRKCRRLKRPYRPNIIVTNGHVQTFLRFLLPPLPVQFNREYLQMKDGGVVALDWLTKPVAKVRRSRVTVLVVLPGNGGSTRTCGGVCRDAAAWGFKTVVFNRRGHGGSILTTPRLSSFGDPTDLRQTIKYIKSKHPKSNIVAIASGGGTDLLFSYLGEYGSSSYIKAAACISPTYDTIQGYTHGSLASVYNYLALTEMKRLVHRHARALSDVIDLPTAFNATTLSDFTERVYGRLNGYTNSGDFWEKNHPLRDVDDIAVPVLCINSVDDPLCSQIDIPFDLFQCSPNFFLVTTEKGGHCGFMEDNLHRSWADSLALEYLDVALDFMNVHGDR